MMMAVHGVDVNCGDDEWATIHMSYTYSAHVTNRDRCQTYNLIPGCFQIQCKFRSGKILTIPQHSDQQAIMMRRCHVISASTPMRVWCGEVTMVVVEELSREVQVLLPHTACWHDQLPNRGSEGCCQHSPYYFSIWRTHTPRQRVTWTPVRTHCPIFSKNQHTRRKRR